MHCRFKLSCFVMAFLFMAPLFGQKSTSATPVGPAAALRQEASAPDSSQAAPPKAGPERVPGYVLGAEDQIIIRAFQAEEITDKPVEIAGDGYISLAMVGRVHAAGLTITELEAELTKRLAKYLEHPQVTVLVSDYRSQPISVIGAVKNPGVIQLRGRKTLVEVIALAGGLLAEAGNTATITRDASNGPIPLANAVNEPAGKISIARLNIRKVMDAQAPEDNIVIQPNDVLAIPRAQMVYVVGEIQKPGGYLLNERDTVSVLQALSLAGGFTANAAPKKAKILREQAGNSGRVEVMTNLRTILAGKSPDIALHADDILFVPDSLPKSAGRTALQTALNMAGVAIWRIP
jgi:polysaccharide biosynthesis/export protein